MRGLVLDSPGLTRKPSADKVVTGQAGVPPAPRGARFAVWGHGTHSPGSARRLWLVSVGLPEHGLKIFQTWSISEGSGFIKNEEQRSSGHSERRDLLTDQGRVNSFPELIANS